MAAAAAALRRRRAQAGSLRTQFLSQADKSKRIGPPREVVLRWLREADASQRHGALATTDVGIVRSVWAVNRRLALMHILSKPDDSNLDMLEAVDIGAPWRLRAADPRMTPLVRAVLT